LDSIIAESKKIVAEWSGKIKQGLIQEGLRTKESAALQKVFQTTLFPHLTNEQSSRIQALLSTNNAFAMTELSNTLNAMSKQHTYQQMQQFLGMVMADKSFFTLAPKEQFLQHLNDMFMTGILNR